MDIPLATVRILLIYYYCPLHHRWQNVIVRFHSEQVPDIDEESKSRDSTYYRHDIDNNMIYRGSSKVLRIYYGDSSETLSVFGSR